MMVRSIGFASGVVAVFLLCAPGVLFAEGEAESEVRAYFNDLPVMIAIAKCESNFTQLGKGGTPLYGGMGGKMIGIFQIYTDIHLQYALDRGMDVTTSAGNLAYARHLYEREGTRPWNSSKSCWADVVETVSAEGAPESGAPMNVVITMDLGMGTVHPQVLMLQKMLNAGGFTIAAEGPGSPGNETDRYGSLTQAAVRKFQCTQKIVCDGDGYSTGYGFFGPRTRAALLALGPTAPVVAASQPASSPIMSAETDPEIARLQAQIAELTKILAELTARSS